MAAPTALLSSQFERFGEPVPTLKHRTNYAHWMGVAVFALVVGAVGYSLVTNENLEIPVIAEYLFDKSILMGVVTTLELTAICMVTGLLGGLVFALMRTSSNRVLSTISLIYVWIFRSIPPIVQLIFWAFFAALYPRLEVGIPLTGIKLFSADTNALISPFMAAVIGFTFIQIAYLAEVIRGGLASVDPGQYMAARAIGMGRGLTLREIILPQAMPSAVPALGNNLIDLVKGTALVSVIGGTDLMTKVQHVYSQTFQVIPLLCVAAIWYLVITGIITIGLAAIERHYGRGAATQRPLKSPKATNV
ncbi:amino acid ABC transporter permease [Rhodococcus sp. NPDC055024]